MNRLAKLFPASAFVSRFIREGMTNSSRALLFGLVFAATSLFTFDLAQAHLFWILLTTIVFAWATGFLFQPRLALLAQVPATVGAGERSKIRLELINRAALGAFDLILQLKQPPNSWDCDATSVYIGTILSEPKKIQIQVTPNVRGVYEWPAVEVASTFPLNLFRRRCPFPIPGELIVLPKFKPIAGAVFQSVARESFGDQSHIQAGQSFDFLGNREYQDGVPVRQWDYRAWARLGYPIVREYCQDQRRTVGIVLDSDQAPNPNATNPNATNPNATTTPEFEATVSLAAALIDKVTSEDSIVEWLITSGSVSKRPTNHNENLYFMQSLARTKLEHDSNKTRLVDRLQEVAVPEFIFLLLHRWNEAIAEEVHQLQDFAASVKTIMVSQKTGSIDFSGCSVLELSIANIESGDVVIQ